MNLMLRKKNNKEIKQYLLWNCIYIILLISLVCLFYLTFNIDKSYSADYLENSFSLVIRIIINNGINFLQYVLLAPLMPIFLFFDIILTSWSISASISIYGIFKTLSKIIPHGIIEIPNFSLYTLISYKLMKSFYKNIRNREYKYLNEIKIYKSELVKSGVLVIVAGVIEGLIT